MSLLKLHRLSVIWKNWMFNQECEHVFQVENSKDNEDSILQREIPARQSRRRFRKINCKGERQTITDDVDVNNYLSVSIFTNISLIFLNVHIQYEHNIFWVISAYIFGNINTWALQIKVWGT